MTKRQDSLRDVYRYIRTMEPTYRKGSEEQQVENEMEYGEDRILIANLAGK